MEKIERGGMRLNRWATSNGNGGMLRVAYEEKLFTYEDIIRCIEVLRTNGRHISDRLFKQLLESIQP